MRLRNEALEELLQLEPSDTGPGFELQHKSGMHTSMSRRGAEMFAQEAVIIEDLRPLLEAWLEHFAAYRCEHRVRFDDESFTWWVNDYAFDLMDDPEHAVLILNGGFHGEDYCVPVYFDRFIGCFTWHPWLREFPS